MSMSAKSQKGMLIAFIVLSQIYTFAYVYLLDFWPPVSPTLSQDQVVALYSQHNMEFRVGAALMMVSGGFNLLFSVVMAKQMARHEDGYPLWATLQLVAGCLGTWLFAFPPFVWGVAAFTIARDPGLTVLLHELAWLCFVTPPSYFALQALPIGVISFTQAAAEDPDTAFPRWLGYLSFWMALSGVFGVMAMLFKTGPFAWNGAISFYLPLTVFVIWLVCLMVTLFRAISRQDQSTRLRRVDSTTSRRAAADRA